MNRLLAASALVIGLAAHTASAAEFDGAWAMEYTSASLATHICVQVQEVASCGDIGGQLSFEGGAVTEASLQSLAAELIADLESRLEEDLPTSVEDRIAAAITRGYDQADAWIGAVVGALPSQLNLDPLERSPSIVYATVESGSGALRQMAGSMDPESGDFALQSGLGGTISREKGYLGHASTHKATALSWQDASGSVAVDVSADADIRLALTPIR